MTLIVETGAGTPGANAYTATAFVDAYLNDRGRLTENDWDGLTTAAAEAAVIKATAYIDGRFGGRFKGVRFNRNVAGRAASGTLEFTGLPLDTETVVIGLKTYRFVASLAQENDVLIGATAIECAENLRKAVAGASTDAAVHEDTLVNHDAIGAVVGSTLEVAARAAGENGNLITFTSALSNVTISAGGLLAGGIDAGPQPLQFPRAGLTDRNGTLIQGVPLSLRQAVAEYAVRSVGSALAPDPTADPSGVPIKRQKNKVGPLEQETEFVDGAPLRTFRPYPVADALLAEYLRPVRAYR